MKNYFKNFAALALSVLLVAGITACNNEIESGNINEAQKVQIILDNDFVTIRMVNNDARAITEQVPYTKKDWAYSTTTVTYGGVSDTTEFYSKNSSINVECKKEGEYTFQSSAYKADKETIIATSDPVIQNITPANGNSDLTITYTNFESYEVTTGVTGTIENQWGEQKENIALLSKDWFKNENAPSKDKVKSISFIKNANTVSFTKAWSGGEYVTVYYNSNNESIVVSAAERTIVAPKDCSLLFRSFNYAESIDLKNFDTSNVTSMYGMFVGCYRLTSLDLSNFDTSKVTNMDDMFRGCSELTTLDVSNFDTSKVSNMYNMFNDCANLTTLDLGNFDTSNVTNMNSMFMHCCNLKTLDVSNFDTSKVTNMSYMFKCCHNIKTLDLRNFDTSNVTSYVSMFEECSSLDVTYNPATWTLSTDWAGVTFTEE